MRRWITGSYPLLEGEPKGGNGRTDADIEATIQRMLDSKGDKGAVGELLRDNFSQREQIRTLKEQIERSPKVPEGGRILTAVELKVLEAYQALGKPEELKTSLEKKTELEQKVLQGERKDAIAAAAEAAGMKATVLGQLPGADKLKFEVREETVDGQKVQVAYVTEPTQGATPKKLTDHADSAWKDFLPSLQADAEETTSGRPGPTNSGGSLFPRQKPAGTPTKKGPASVDDIAEAKRATRDYASL